MAEFIRRLEIENIQAIEREEIEFPEFGAVVKVGPNGIGKSSTAAALLDFFRGGSDPAILRNGSKRASISVEFSNGDTIKKILTRSAGRINSRLEATHADGTKMDAPQTYIRRFADRFNYDPLGFIKAAPKDRLEWLLKVRPIAFSPDEVCRAVGEAVSAQELPAEPCTITQFDQLKKRVAELRRSTGVRAEEKTANVNQLREQVKKFPPATGDDREALAAARAEKDRLEADERTEYDSIKSEAGAQRADIVRQQNESEGQMRAWMEDEIQKIRREYDAKVDAIRRGAFDTLAIVATAERESLDELSSRFSARKQELATIIANAENAAQTAAARDAVTNLFTSADQERLDAWKKHAALDNAVHALEDLRKSKLTTLPVEGLTIGEDGMLYFNGIELDRVNKARLVTLAIEIALLDQRDGITPFVVLDEAECMQGNTWDEFVEACRYAPFQALVLRAVDKGPVRIEKIAA